MKNQRAAARHTRKIPPPPGADASDAEIVAYHARYSLEELEKAGYAEAASAAEAQALSASANYASLVRKGLHLKLVPKDYERLSVCAAQEDRTVESLVKQWIRERLRQERKASKDTVVE